MNLAAIDELEGIESERKEYLDRQFADVTAALDHARRGHAQDRPARRARASRTRSTASTPACKDKFPALFGGGHAYLELVGEDMLERRRRRSWRARRASATARIHQLSGGEKALTAVALVFSIFDLNPAPFCLLDEVDAPLDEHNVGRFCDIVQARCPSACSSSSSRTTRRPMELASQLIGVTMTRAGLLAPRVRGRRRGGAHGHGLT